VGSQFYTELLLSVEQDFNLSLPLTFGTNSVNCDRPDECSPEKDCLR